MKCIWVPPPPSKEDYFINCLSPHCSLWVEADQALHAAWTVLIGQFQREKLNILGGTANKVNQFRTYSFVFLKKQELCNIKYISTGMPHIKI